MFSASILRYIRNLTELANAPIRVSPNLLLFPQTAALKEIYWEPKLNNKGQFYASGALGPPTMFTTIDGAEHKELRKALAGPKVPV